MLRLTRCVIGAVSVCLPVSAVLAAATPASKPASAPATQDSVLVTVNGQKITEGDLDTQLRQMMEAQSGGRPVNEMQFQQTRQRFHDQLVQFMIDEELVGSEVAKQKLTVSDKEIETRVEEMFQDAMKSQSMTREEFNDTMQQRRGMTLQQMADRLKTDPNMRKQVLREKLLNAKRPAELKITDEDVAAYYRENQKQFSKPELVKASHILIDTRRLKTDDEKQAARKKAEDLAAKAKAPGADFAALAKEHSSCPSKAKGGDLGFFARQGPMVEPFAAAAFAMKPGEVSDVVETQFGFHIIKVTDRKGPETLTEEKAADTIRAQLRRERIEKVSKEYVQELKDKAKIEYPPGKGPQVPASLPGLGARPRITTRPAGVAARPTTQPVAR